MNDSRTAEKLTSRPKERVLGRMEMMEVQQFPCDGIPRYSVSGVSKDRHTYSVAYDGVLAATGCKRGENGAINFSANGLKRIAHLNRSYLLVASDFVRGEIARGNAQMAAALKAVEATPVPDPMAVAEPQPA